MDGVVFMRTKTPTRRIDAPTTSGNRAAYLRLCNASDHIEQRRTSRFPPFNLRYLNFIRLWFGIIAAEGRVFVVTDKGVMHSLITKRKCRMI